MNHNNDIDGLLKTENFLNSTRMNHASSSFDSRFLLPTLDSIYNFSITQNESSSEEDEHEFVPYLVRPETYIVPVLFAIIFVIGVLGNGTLIAIFIRNRSTRNVPNMYICSLTVGDILVILFCVPFTSTLYTFESWPYGLVVCKFSEFIKDVSVGVSVFTLTALSADRYFAIADPMKKLTGRRATKITWLTIGGIWLLSTVFALPSAIFSYLLVITEDGAEPQLVACYPFPQEFGISYPRGMVLFKFLVYYAIPLAFIASFYIFMARHLVRSTKNMPGEAQGQGQANNKQIQARKKVAKMVLSFVVIFALCFLPSHAFFLWFYYNPDAEHDYNAFWHVLRIVGFCLGFINSCVNPITLYCVSGTFRKHFNQNLFCCIFKAPRSRSNRSRRSPGINCGCVSISSSGVMYGHRNAGGSLRSNKSHGISRGSSTLKGSPKRKSTWETQTTGTGTRKTPEQLVMITYCNITGNNSRSDYPIGNNSIRSAVTTVIIGENGSKKYYGSFKRHHGQTTMQMPAANGNPTLGHGQSPPNCKIEMIQSNSCSDDIVDALL